MSSLNDITMTQAKLLLPSRGVWWCDCEIDSPEALAGEATIVLGDSTFIGTIVSGGVYRGRARYRIAGGAGAWGSDVTARHYASDAGVRLSTVLSDLAADVGEVMGTIGTATVGAAWMREAGPASRQLDLLAPDGWYVDAAGVTQLGTYADTDYAGTAAKTEAYDVAAGRVVLAAETLVGLVPGALVGNVRASDVEINLDAGKLRVTLWDGGAAASRAPDAMRRIVDSLTSHLRYRGIWEYRIVTQSSERLALQAVRPSSGMPDLRNVRVRPGVPGVSALHKYGSLVLVSFIDGDPARPVVVGFEDAESSGFIPRELTLAAGTTGTESTEHATSAESLVSLVDAVLTAIGISIPGPVTGAALAGAKAAILNAAIPLTATVPITPYSAAISAALAAKLPDTLGDTPSIGWPKVMGG